MTNREFYHNVIAYACNGEDEINGVKASDLIAVAQEQIEKLDARNATRNSKPSKTQLENAPIKEALLNYLTTNGGQYTEAELGAALDITHNKAGALARQLVAEGKATSAEVKFPKVGKRKVYFISQS